MVRPALRQREGGEVTDKGEKQLTDLMDSELAELVEEVGDV